MPRRRGEHAARASRVRSSALFRRPGSRDTLGVGTLSRYFRREQATSAGAFIDARSYYRALYHSARHAQRFILLCGWQFDSTVRLLRGEDAEDAPYPTELLEFLDALCLERPELQVHLLAWDYSLVFLPERELMQRWVFERSKSGRVHFHFDSNFPAGGSHHQKFAVVDGNLAFVGGMDVCSSRWDDSEHRAAEPERRNTRGLAYGPFHDVQAFVVGEAARAVHALFLSRFRAATGTDLALTADRRDERWSFVLGDAPLPAGEVGLSRTFYGAGEAVQEVAELFFHAIENANELVYVETQYLTSIAIRDSLVRRFRDASRGKLNVVVVLPESPNAKEDLALGNAQAQVVRSLAEVAEERGHALRVFYPGPRPGSDGPSTYVHAKLLIVDDHLLIIGSANLTNRSLSLDSELCLTWDAPASSVKSERIRDLRCKLLAEHAGQQTGDRFRPMRGLVEELDFVVRQGSRLRAHPVLAAQAGAPGMAAVLFDPIKPLDELEVDDLLSASSAEWFARGIEVLESWLSTPDLKTSR